MRVLVTGGAGFLGSHLCDRLLAANHDVLCLDNFHTGQRQNIAHLLGNSRFEVIEHDITEALSVDVDQIYNLACPASPVQYQENAVKTVKTNVLGALHVLGIAKRTGARVLQASTSEVYGDPEVHPQPESYRGNTSCIGPRACYDEGKRVAETLFMDYHRAHGVDIRIARIFNTYGPRMHIDDGRVVSNFIVQALRGDALTIYGDGQQTRSFCFVDDLISGLMALMAKGDEQPTNLGNPVEISMLELAERILRLSNSTTTLTHLPLPEDDPVRRNPDITRAHEMLKWQPTVDIEAGLGQTIAYFREALTAET